MKISVVIPVFNRQDFLGECLLSCVDLTLQDDYEIIVVDDGSTDSTAEIAKKFPVKYFRLNHRGISAALNRGIKESSGKYIARMDSDDIMLPDRLEKLYNYMESHPEVDILACGFEWMNGKPIKEYFIPRGNSFGLIGHPTVIMRKESLDKLPFIYEDYFNGNEDRKLWFTARLHGLNILTDPMIVIRYRLHPGLETVTGINCTAQKCEFIANLMRMDNSGELTCIIPFRNEREEVEKTVASIRCTSKCKIILINDGSDDGYNYDNLEGLYNCTYVKNVTSLGVAKCRNYGVALCKTEYFVLLDAHMRFYSQWDTLVVELLKKYPNSILTSTTHVMTKKDGFIENEYSPSSFTNNLAVCRINMKHPGWEFTAKWNSTPIKNSPLETNEVIPTPCVLGAFYASTKSHWNRIHGLSGLQCYGHDEPFMSIKTWLLGGSCLLIKNFKVGHLYRSKFPYTQNNFDDYVNCNLLFIMRMFSGEKYVENLKKRIGEVRFNAVSELYNKNKAFFDSLIEYINNNKQMSIEDFLTFNNNGI